MCVTMVMQEIYLALLSHPNFAHLARASQDLEKSEDLASVAAFDRSYLGLLIHPDSSHGKDYFFTESRF